MNLRKNLSHFFGQSLNTLLTTGLFILASNPSASAGAPNCRINPQDPFEPNASLTSGLHEGECVRTESFRSYRILSEAEVNQIPAFKTFSYQHYYFIANLQHDHAFWVAVFERSKSVKRYLFQAEHFPPEWLAAHTQLRVDFAAGKEPFLFLQTNFNRAPLRISSFVLSNEAVPYRGGPDFNIYYGIRDYYAFGNRLMSLDDIVEKTKKTHHTTEQFELRFNQDADINAFLNFDLMKFHDPEISSIYHTLYHNCSNSLFESFDEFLAKDRSRRDRIETTLPLTFKDSLKLRGLIDENSEQKTLNEEFEMDSSKLTHALLSGISI